MINQEQLEQQRNTIASLIRAEAADENWSELLVRFGEFEDLMYASASIVVDGQRRAFRVASVEAQTAWVQLKRLEATDRGAWLSSELTLSSSGGADFSANFDRRPNFAATNVDAFYDPEGTGATPDDAALIQELRRFPRADDAIPAWWKQLLIDGARENAAKDAAREQILVTGRLPFGEDRQRVTRAAYYLHTTPEIALANHRELPDLHAVLVWVPTRGGGKIVMGDDDVLFGNSTLTSEQLVQMYREGRRTDAALFDEPRATPEPVGPSDLESFLVEFPAAAKAIAQAIRVEPSRIAQHATYLPELGAVYAWQGFVGGDQCVAGADGSVLFGFSSLNPAVLIAGYAGGRRTPSASLLGERSGNPGSCAEVLWRRMHGDGTAVATDDPRTVEQMASLLDVTFVDTSIDAIPGQLMALGGPSIAVIAIERADGPGTWQNAVFDGVAVNGIDATLGQTFDWPADFGLVTGVKAAFGAIR